MEDEKVAEATDTAEGTEAAPQMSLEELIAQAQTAGTEKLEVVENRGKDSGKKPKSDGPRKATTAEAFAEALELVGEGQFVTVKSVCAIMEYNGWTSNSRTEREKFVAVKSAIYNRMRAGQENPKMALPIDWSKSRDGLFAFKPIVTQDEAENADEGKAQDADPTPDEIPTE